MSVDELIQQFQISSRLMKRAIACDDSDAITRLDEALTTTLERIVTFDVRDDGERMTVGRFLAGYLADMRGGSLLSSRISARMVELIGIPDSSGSEWVAKLNQ